MATVAWFKELHKSDTGTAGGKGANLGELENAGFPVPPGLQAEVLDAYHHLGQDALVAVRSSATTEDLAGASFAGMNQTFTNVCGDDQLISRLRDCWRSIFGDRVITYRGAEGVVAEPAIAVIVQEMLCPDASGVIFTSDPSFGDLSRIVIEAAFGQGEVSRMTPKTDASTGPKGLKSRQLSGRVAPSPLV
jgi:phosphoenolpyruvate synthase/pyruvate phosphate dikinase